MSDVSRTPRPLQAHGRPAIDWEVALRGNERWLRTVVRGRLGEADAVDDVLQNVAVAALDARHCPREQDKIGPWLYRVAVRQCLMHRRRAGRQRRLFAHAAADRNGAMLRDDDPLLWLLGRERQAAVRQALARLNELDRQVLTLKHTEDWSYQELADHLGVNVRTIEHRLLQARQRLRKELVRLSVIDPGP
jgi:RNA polymerase sigma-70 factor (ECF subfamily)